MQQTLERQSQGKVLIMYGKSFKIKTPANNLERISLQSNKLNCDSEELILQKTFFVFYVMIGNNIYC